MAAGRRAPSPRDGASEVIEIVVPAGAILLLMALVGTGAMRRRVINGYANRLRDRHPLRALFISKINRAFVGLTLDGKGLLLGDRRFEKVYPFSDVHTVEVIHTSARGRLRSLIVRIQVHNDDRVVHDYAIFDWPNDWGPKETQPHVKAMFDQAERVRAMVVEGMGRAA